MKIIRTQNPESTKFFFRKKTPYIVRIIFLICILSIAIVLIFNKKGNKDIEPIVYSSEDDVVDIFNSNKVQFEQMASLLYGSDIFRQMYDETDHNCIFYSSNIKNKVGLSDDDILCIRDFFKENRLYEISPGYNYLSFDFLTKKEGCRILYIPHSDSEIISQALMFVKQDCDVSELGGYWYLAVNNSEIHRNGLKKIKEMSKHLEFLFSDFDEKINLSKRLAEILFFDIKGEIKDVKLSVKNNNTIEASIYDDSNVEYYVIINAKSGMVESVYVGGLSGRKVYEIIE